MKNKKMLSEQNDRMHSTRMIAYLEQLLMKKDEKLDAEKRKEITEYMELVIEKTNQKFEMMYNQNDMEHLQAEIRYFHKLAENIDQYASKKDEFYLYLFGYFNGVYQTYADYSSKCNKEEIFQTQMACILNRANVKDVLFYLYEHEHVQHKKICDAIRIQPSQLNRIMTLLTSIDAVICEQIGKYKYYDLTKPSRKYVKITLGYRTPKSIDIYITGSEFPVKPSLEAFENKVLLTISSDDKVQEIDYTKYQRIGSVI